MSELTEKFIDLYGGSVQIRFTEENHAYWLIKDGKALDRMKRLTGVTSFTGKVFDKSDSLIGWALDLTIDYIADNQKMLKKGKADELFEAAKMQSEESKKLAAEIGKTVHAWIEAHAKGGKPDMPDNPKVLKAVNSFIEWTEKNGVEFLWSERVVYSRKFGYVGTADTGLRFKKGDLKGMTVLGDYKVSNGLYLPVRMQTAAYQSALQEEDPKAKFDGRLAIRISAESEQEYMERMTKKWSKKNYKIGIPPYQMIQTIFMPADTYDKDRKAALMAWDMIQYQREMEKEMRS